MGNYTKAESRLRNINMDRIYVESLKAKLELIELEYNVRGIAYDGIGGGGGGGTSDVTGDTAINIMDNKQDIELKVKQKESEISHLDNILSCLTVTEEKIIKLYYIRYKPYWSIARDVDYSISQVKRIKKDAMLKIIRGLYGE